MARPTTEDVNRLPMWAQRRIDVLERNLAAANERLEQVLGAKDPDPHAPVLVDMLAGSELPLPRRTIRFPRHDVDKLTLAEIEAAEAAAKRVDRTLAAMGREIYEIREGEKLGSGFSFQSYSIEPFEGSNFSGQEGPDWGKGTQIVSVSFYWERASYGRYVTFPVSYLDIDWREEEYRRVEAERQEAERICREEQAGRRRRRDLADRANYERLKARFEGEAANA